MTATNAPTTTPPVATTCAAAPVNAETDDEAVIVTLEDALAVELAPSHTVHSWLAEADAEPVADDEAAELPAALDEAAVELPAEEAALELAAAELDGVGEAWTDAGLDELPLEPEPEPALAETQEQTARAELETARPVTAPQALTTQPSAADWMAADWDDEHWQAKSPAPQPAAEAADMRQEEPHAGTWAATEEHASWALARAAPRTMRAEMAFIVMVVFGGLRIGLL